MVSKLSTEERIEQLKLCCLTIMDNADAIVKGIEHQIDAKVTINIPPQGTLTITLEQEIYSDRVLKHIVNR